MLIRNLEPGQAAIRSRRVNKYQTWRYQHAADCAVKPVLARDARATPIPAAATAIPSYCDPPGTLTPDG